MATAATVLASTAIVANVTLSLTAYFTSNLLTRFSTWFKRVNISRLVSFISVCNVSRLVAICSTALVSLITAAAASSLRREKPNSPIAATLMLAPAIAANTSITALCWCCLYPSSRAALALWLVRVAHQAAPVMLLRFQPPSHHRRVFLLSSRSPNQVLNQQMG